MQSSLRRRSGLRIDADRDALLDVEDVFFAAFSICFELSCTAMRVENANDREKVLQRFAHSPVSDAVEIHVVRDHPMDSSACDAKQVLRQAHELYEIIVEIK